MQFKIYQTIKNFISTHENYTVDDLIGINDVEHLIENIETIYSTTQEA